jgi:hypothetical protein
MTEIDGFTALLRLLKRGFSFAADNALSMNTRNQLDEDKLDQHPI